MITVSQLWIYPFKSGKGLSVPSATLDEVGLCNDRRLVAMDQNGVVLTARRYPQLLLLSSTRLSRGWWLQHPAMSKGCYFEIEESASPILGTLWKDSICAENAGDDAAQWLSELLQDEARVGLWRGQSRYSAKYQLESSFADSAPILLASAASVRQTCEWAGIEADVRRFRPNIVLEGVEPFAEDAWAKLCIGEHRFEALDCCVRCILTTVHPDNGDAHPQMQPLSALRNQHVDAARRPIFGINLRLSASPVAGATLSIGDEVILQ